MRKIPPRAVGIAPFQARQQQLALRRFKPAKRQLALRRFNPAKRQLADRSSPFYTNHPKAHFNPATVVGGYFKSKLFTDVAVFSATDERG